MYILKEGYVLEDLNYSQKDFRKDFQEVLKSGLIAWDERHKIILIKGHLEHNPITNKNQIIFIGKILDSLPNTLLFNDLIDIVKGLSKGLPKELLKALTDSISIKITIPIEIESESESLEEEQKPKKPSKKKYLDNVYLTDEEHQKLIERFGKQGADDRIEELDLGIGSKGYKYVSHYKAILSWARKNGDKPQDKSSYQSIIDGAKREIARRERLKETEIDKKKLDEHEGHIRLERGKIESATKKMEGL
jgi:hypothetical protein